MTWGCLSNTPLLPQQRNIEAFGRLIFSKRISRVLSTVNLSNILVLGWERRSNESQGGAFGRCRSWVICISGLSGCAEIHSFTIFSSDAMELFFCHKMDQMQVAKSRQDPRRKEVFPTNCVVSFE